MPFLRVIYLYYTKHTAMKTKKNSNPTLPSPVKFSIYLIAVAAVCFLNWNALKASDFVAGEALTLEARLEAALVPVTENEIELDDWMLQIENNQVAENTELEIALEDWMLTFNDNLIADSEESEIVLADWMLTVPDSAPAPAIEDWIVNSDTWFKVEFLATK